MVRVPQRVLEKTPGTLRRNFLVTNWIQLSFTTTVNKIHALYFNGVTEKVKEEESVGREEITGITEGKVNK